MLQENMTESQIFFISPWRIPSKWSSPAKLKPHTSTSTFHIPNSSRPTNDYHSSHLHISCGAFLPYVRPAEQLFLSEKLHRYASFHSRVSRKSVQAPLFAPEWADFRRVPFILKYEPARARANVDCAFVPTPTVRVDRFELNRLKNMMTNWLIGF